MRLPQAARWAALISLLFLILTSLAVWRAPEIAAWRWFLREGKPTLISAKLVLLPPLRWLDDYYVVADLGKNTFAIGEPRYGQCNFSYLIIGSTRALLFDTGPGVRNIAPIVRQLTSLPVEALPSHLHFDHTGDLARFADVALPDLPALRGQVHDGRFAFGLYQYLGFVEGFKRPSVHVSRWIASGSKIDLGDRNLIVESLPGHTPDSVVLLDEAANRLFAGDFIYPSEIYAFLPGADLKTYAASARRLTKLVDAQTLIYGAHGCDRLPTVDVPTLKRADAVALTRALDLADTGAWAAGTGWYPRRIPVNERMELLAKYPWMQP
jgi:hydroxyacylglutathione hydrolase